MEHQAIEVVSEETPRALALAGEMSVEEIVDRVAKVQEVQREVMRDGTHYGKVPGVGKPTLLKPGAEILGMVFRLDAQFDVTEHRDGDHLTVVVKCVVYHQGTGARLGSGLGSCSTKESKYAWRKGSRKCPSCGKEGAIIKGKKEYGGGWVCFAKKNGCGAKFADGDQAIEGQQTDRVPNPDLYDQHNTVLKMAIKRAHVAAILFVTCASEIFTQDAEDIGGPMPGERESGAGKSRPRSDGGRKQSGKSGKPSNETQKRTVDIKPMLEAYENSQKLSDVSTTNKVVAAVQDQLSREQYDELIAAKENAEKRLGWDGKAKKEGAA